MSDAAVVTISPPYAPFLTLVSTAWSINNIGQIVGYYTRTNAIGGLIYTSGFLDDGDVYTDINPLGDPVAGYVENHGINDAGQMVGYYSCPYECGAVPPFEGGFLYDGGVFTPIIVPDYVIPGQTSFGTHAYGINNAAQIVGYFSANPSGGLHGFLYNGGVFTAIDVPGAANTQVFGINDAGQIVGAYQDATGTYHGFIGVPNIFPPPVSAE